MALNNLVNNPLPVGVTKGGTGLTTATTAYAPIISGTTATGNFQVASSGLSNVGYVFTSNGSSAVPSFQAAPGANGFTSTNIQVFTSSNMYTPTSGMKYCIIEGVGGGGGGGDAGTNGGAGGGGSGAYSRVYASAATVGASGTVTIGSGGGHGTGGGTTTFANNGSTNLISCTGGSAGSNATIAAGSGGGGGTATLGTLNISGGTGAPGFYIANSPVFYYRGGNGADSQFGQAGPGGANSGGGASTGYGSGGGGGGGTGQNGGSARDGIVIITEFI